MTVPATVANPPVMMAWVSDSVSLVQNGLRATLDSTCSDTNRRYVRMLYTRNLVFENYTLWYIPNVRIGSDTKGDKRSDQRLWQHFASCHNVTCIALVLVFSYSDQLVVCVCMILIKFYSEDRPNIQLIVCTSTRWIQWADLYVEMTNG